MQLCVTAAHLTEPNPTLAPPSYLELISFQSDLIGPVDGRIPYETTLPMWETEVRGGDDCCCGCLEPAHLKPASTHAAAPAPPCHRCLALQAATNLTHTHSFQLALRLNLCQALTALGRGLEGVEVLREVKTKLPDNAKVRRRRHPRG